MKLLTIGDSVSQGFMSMAAARTDLSYSTLLARAMNLKPGSDDYRFPSWGANGLPLNLENLLRRLDAFGLNLSKLKLLQTAARVIVETQNYYQFGAGNAQAPYDKPGNIKFFHNIAVEGFDVADAWLMTPRVCKNEIRRASQDMTFPSAYFYRTALKVLNPSLDARFDDFSQLDWLDYHAKSDGVENLILWLGANNALGTVLSLQIKQTPGDGSPNTITHVERAARGWNLWHPVDFEAEYRALLTRVDAIMQHNTAADWRVFIGTVPLVTIAPLATGIGHPTDYGDKGIYYQYYVYFPFEEDFARATKICLTMEQALQIDDWIRAYNETIRGLVKEFNGKHGATEPYRLVNIADAMQRIAYKRNAGRTTYDFPPYFNQITPLPDTRFYHIDAQGQRLQGGLFSLDGVHPSAIGQGLLAHEFIKVMSDRINFNNLDWPEIFAADTLYATPIPLLDRIYKLAPVAELLLAYLQHYDKRK